MKKIIFLVFVFCSTLSSSFALSPVINEYPNSEEFLKAEGNICESATDGCNSIGIIDGKIGESTMMYCEDIYGTNGQEKWSCTNYKLGSEPIIDDKLDDTQICTMQYAPVCAQVQVQCIKAPCPPILQTFGNSCTAGKNKIVYEGECNDYVNVDLYNKFLSNQEEIQAKISKVDSNLLGKVVELIPSIIEKTKILNISEYKKKVLITKYVFLKYIINKEISENMY